MNQKYLLLLCIFLLTSIQSYSQEGNSDDPGIWTPEDIIAREAMRSVSFSPAGDMLVWTKGRQLKKKDRFVSDIYLTKLNRKKDGKFVTVRLTTGEENNSNPLFSKDGQYVYFLSSREKSNKLWRLNLEGGEAEKVKEFKNGISTIRWQDANTLLFVSSDGKSLYEQELEKIKDNVLVVEDSLHWRARNVYAYDLKKKTITKVTNLKKPIGFYNVSRDGKWLIYSMQRSRSFGADAQQDPFYYLQNMMTGEVKEILKGRGYPIGGVQFSGDHKGFYFQSSEGSDPEWNGAGIRKVYYYEIASDTYKEVDLKWDMGASGGYIVAGNDIVVALSNKTYYRLAYYKKRGMKWSKLPFDLKDKNDHAGIFAITKDGSKIVYDHSTSSQLPQYYVSDLSGNKVSNETVLVELNKGLKKKRLAKSEVITWKGYKGEEVTGLLFYPENYEVGKRYPLMLSIHGGPASQDLDRWSDRWSTYPNILAQKGMFILKPNYHGSANHGLEYVESIKGNYYEPEMADIMSAIDLLVEQGKVDKAQIGTMGWSNGAIITTMLTVRYPDLFKVAAAGAGDVNWTSDFGTCGFGVSFDQSYFIGAPWDDMNGKTYNENYILKSPLFELEKVKTPTIIFHGSEDRAVPRDQGWEYYRALQQVGKAPVKFLWFPGQPHGLRKITHQLRKMKEEIAWIEQHLLKKDAGKNEAFKKDSPLAAMLKLQQAKKDKNLYGVVQDGLLLPEVVQVKEDSIAIGRFELTNAQYQAYKTDHQFAAGEENYPAAVTRTEATNYVKWLADKTGDAYRLPSAAEAKVLHKTALKVASKANNLNYWAGYTLTAADVPALRQKLTELNLTLLEEVGSRQSAKVGKAALYDLGGNLAEYYEGGIYGLSAYDFYDQHNQEMIESTNVGLRVIKEK